MPGTGVRHRHKGKSGSNKSGSLNKLNLEWSGQGRKEEDDLRGINNRARQQAIEDQLTSHDVSDRDWLAAEDAANCWDDNNDVGTGWEDDNADDLWLIL